MKKLLTALICLLLPFLLSSSIYGKGEFRTTYDVTYTATKEGKLFVHQEISLTNNLSNIYATQYSLILDGGTPQNISASDSTGPLQHKVENQGDRTKIILFLKDQVVGKDKTLKFYLDYENKGFLNHYGRVWEVILPKVSEDSDIDQYRVTLQIPTVFGKPSSIFPNPTSQKSSDKEHIYIFDKNQLAATGVIAAFGDFQVFDFVIVYHLINPTGDKIRTKIALPPDTNYQKLHYDRINPEPENVEPDIDGNWMATYSLAPDEKKDVITYGQAEIFAQPRLDSPQENPKNNKNLLTAKKYWEVDDSTIKDLAQRYKTPKEIFDFVVGSLDYDYSRIKEGVTRFGALKALNEPKRAICMEFTDLFVAISRAAGIPARELDGYAHTDNPELQPLSLTQDVLHAWPEYWDKEKRTWVQVDPTWEKTTGGIDYFNKLDMGHFVFAIHGQDSTLPLPAGAYKDKQNNKKDIQISFGEYKEPSTPLVSADFLLPDNMLTIQPVEGKIRIQNTGKEAIYNVSFQIETEGIYLISEPLKTLSVLPPGGYQDINIKAKAPNFFSSNQGKIIVSGNKQIFEYNINYGPFQRINLLPYVIFLITLPLLFFLAKRLRKFLKSRKENNETKIERTDQENPV